MIITGVAHGLRLFEVQPELSRSHISSPTDFWYVSGIGYDLHPIEGPVVGMSICKWFCHNWVNMACGNVETWSWASWGAWASSSNIDCLLWLIDLGWKLDCGGIARSSLLVCKWWHSSHSLFSVSIYLVFQVWSKRSHWSLHSVPRGSNVPNVIDLRT